MGALCSCCPLPEDYWEEYGHPNVHGRQNCFCVRYCFRWCIRAYRALFEFQDDRRLGGSPSGTSAGPSAVLLSPSRTDTSNPDSYRAPPMPLPFDHRNLRPRGPGGKGGSERQQQEGGEAMALLRRGVEVSNVPPPPREEAAETEETKKMASIKRNTSVMSFTDEECCPTCLDGYTEENPKIQTACLHHFHLSCIYEWMERSNRCPVCDKEMVFDER